MIKCACGFENPEGVKYCEDCGAELPQIAGTTGESIEETAKKIKCPACGNLNTLENKVCEVCGESLIAGAKPAEPATPQPIVTATPPTVPTPPMVSPTGLMGKVKLTVEQGMTIGKQFLLNDPDILIGRLDEEENIHPEIDLTDQDEGYVSRRHAKIEMKGDKMFITHLSETNPTLLNKEKITKDAPKEFKVGDKIKVGKIVLRVQEV